MKLKVNSEGEITCVLNWLKVGEKTIMYPEKIPGLAGVSAMIGIMPVDRAEMRNREVITKGSLSEILDDWGGVYVRHKDFRVYPYGEPGNDWLNIDRDRGIRRTALSEILQPFAAKLRGVNPQRALLSLLSSKSYIGEIENGERAVGFSRKLAEKDSSAKRELRRCATHRGQQRYCG